MGTQRYITIQEWMLDIDPELKFTEVAVFAIIWGFSQDGSSVYRGSTDYLAYWLRLSKVSVLSILKKLTEKGYIIKEEEKKNGAIKSCNYRVAPQYVRVKNLYPRELKKLTRTGKEILPNNKEINKKEKTTAASSLYDMIHGSTK